MLTPGPAAILHEHLDMFGPVFGRGDSQYESIFNKVTNWIKKLANIEIFSNFPRQCNKCFRTCSKVIR